MIAELAAFAELRARTLLLPGVPNQSCDQTGNGVLCSFHIDAQAVIASGLGCYRPD
jgi:hypothetical protein